MYAQYLIWDVCFNLFKISIKDRRKFISKKSENKEIRLKNGTTFRYGVVDYVKFRESVEDYSLNIIKWENDERMRFEKSPFDTYVSFKSLLSYLTHNFCNKKLEVFYQDCIEILFWDNSFNGWRASIIREIEKEFNLSNERVGNIKKSLLVKKGLSRDMKLTEDSFLISLACSYLSENRIDDLEKKAILLNFKDDILKKKESYQGELDYLLHKTGLSKYSQEEKEVIVAFCGSLVTCDGEIAKKEVILLDKVMSDLKFSKKRMSKVKELSGLSISEMIEKSSVNISVMCLYYGLYISSADGAFNEKEERILSMALNKVLKDGRYSDHVLMLLLIQRYFLRMEKFILKEKRLKSFLFSLVESKSNEFIKRVVELYRIFSFDEEDSFKDGILEFLPNKFLRWKRSNSGDYQKSGLEILGLFSLDHSSYLAQELSLRDRLIDYCLKISSSNFQNNLWLIFQFILLDDHIELLEDEFFIKLCLHHKVGERKLRKELFLASFIHSKNVIITDFLDYSQYQV